MFITNKTNSQFDKTFYPIADKINNENVTEVSNIITSLIQENIKRNMTNVRFKGAYDVTDKETLPNLQAITQLFRDNGWEVALLTRSTIGGQSITWVIEIRWDIKGEVK